MNKKEVKKRFDELAKQLWNIKKECCKLNEYFELEMDCKAMREIQTDLTWACENLSVLGLHQIDEALDDNMGTGINPKDKVI